VGIETEKYPSHEWVNWNVKNLHTEVKKVSYLFSKIGWSWTSTGTELQQESMKRV